MARRGLGGGRPTGSSGGGPMDDETVPPTKREREILVLIAEGKSNRQIAEALFVSENTIETHVAHLMHKLGATRRWWASYFLQRLAQHPAETRKTHGYRD